MLQLRGTESVPLCEDIHKYMKREVLLHIPDAWVDESKTKIGYEPPRPLKEIEADIQSLEKEIMGLLSDIVRS